MTALLLATAADELVGCPFRLHGRDPATGLDCVGVLAVALGAIGQVVTIPSGYRMRTGHFPLLQPLARELGFATAEGRIAAGDVLITRPGPGQMHLLIASTEEGYLVEAHAGLRRVVLSPGPTNDPVLHHWRYRTFT